ncbi:MAG: hypothetical protein PUB22_00960 [Clostridiales bacterium]|nr:hypothetical protein [Clostridiales bacterium]
MKRWKQFWAKTLFLIVVLAAAGFLLPPAAECQAAKKVCTIGSKSYTSLEAAVKEAKKGASIKLTANTSLSKNIEVGKKLTIDLNGMTLDTKKKMIWANKKGDLTITGKAKSQVKSHSDYWAAAVSDGKLTLAGQITWTGAVYSDNGELTIKNGTFKKTAATEEQASGLILAVGGELTISGGTFEATNMTAINCPSAGSLTISGGTFTGKGIDFDTDEVPSALSYNGAGIGNVTITKGTFSSPVDIYFANIVKISGGTFKKSVYLVNNSKNKITGGKFSKNGGKPVITKL